MKPKRIRYLIAFVVALFLANSFASAAGAFVHGLGGQDRVAAQALDANGVEHVMFVADDEAACFMHCVQAYKHPGQQTAPNAFKVGFLPALFAAYFSAAIKPAASGVALAPQAAGPPLTILFRKLRN